MGRQKWKGENGNVEIERQRWNSINRKGRNRKVEMKEKNGKV